MAIVLVLGLVGVGAFAYFGDAETSIGNAFTAGTLDLKVSDTNEGYGDGVSATWTMSNMQPGVDTVGPYTVSLQNSGSLAGNHVEISFSHSIDDTPDVESDTNPDSVPADMAEWIEITSMSYSGSDFATGYTDANGNGFFDLDDVTWPAYAAEGGILDNHPAPAPNNGGTRTFTMALRFNAGATKDIQGDTLTTVVTFTLNQDSSQ